MKKSLFTLQSFASFFVLLSLVGTSESAKAMEEEIRESSNNYNSKKRALDDKEKEKEAIVGKKEKTGQELIGALAFMAEQEFTGALAFMDFKNLDPLDPGQQEAPANTNAAPVQQEAVVNATPAQTYPRTEKEVEKEVLRSLTSAHALYKFNDRAKKGDKEAINFMAEQFYRFVFLGTYNSETRETYKNISQWVAPAAENGNPFAQSLMGFSYARGQMPGGKNEENDKKAIELFQKTRKECIISKVYLGCLVAQERTHGLVTDMSPTQVESYLRTAIFNTKGFIHEDVTHSLLCMSSKKTVALETEVKSLRDELARLKAGLSDVMPWVKNL